MSKHGQLYNEQLTHNTMDRYMSDHKDRMEHREVEGLVEEFKKRFGLYELRYVEHGKESVERIMGTAIIQDWLRTALTTHGAKEREAGDAAGYERGREEERKAAEKPLREALEEAYTFGFKAAKERAVSIAKKHLSPQTDVTK